MKQADILEAVEKALGLPSDYALAKHMGVARETISQYRRGKMYFSDEVAHKFAEILGWHLGFVLLAVQRERAKTEETKTVWDEIFKGFRKLLPPANLGKGFSPA